MSSIKRSLAAILLGASVTLVLSPDSLAQPSVTPETIPQFEAFDEASNLKIDYTAWSQLLEDIVLDVGFSDRRPAIGPPPVRTGTRIRVSSSSRYRYEANRVLYHIIDDGRAAALSEYREELAQLPNQVPLRSLSSNQQLAYWLNLHNVIVLDELLKDYPTTWIDEPWDDDPDSLFERQVVIVEGIPLSLNNIRHDIVGATWNDPRVMYGFHLGAVGGPSIRQTAYDGDRVWSQLERTGREFVNALRGVENRRGSAQISPVFFEHQYIFKSWPDDLFTHLRSIGDAEVDRIINAATSVSPLRWDGDIADLTNGHRCSGSSGFFVQSIQSDGRLGFNGSCNPVPPQARHFIIQITERRLRMLRNGDIGRVTIRDLPDQPQTDETNEPPSN